MLELGLPCKLEEPMPVVGAVRQYDDPVILRAAWSPMWRTNAAVTEVTVLRPESLSAEVLDEVERSHRLSHRNFERRTLAAACPVE